MRRTSLSVVAVALAVNLPLIACGMLGPTRVYEPTATAVSTPVTVRLAPDGRGDYPSLEAAVDAVPAGTTIILEPGTYRLDESLEIRQAVRLVGAGMEETRIVCEAGAYVVRFSGDGPFAAEDITFRHEAEAEANVVVVADGHIDFVRCRFTGAVWTEGTAGRAGLRLEGSTTGAVRECMAVENNGHGIRVVDRAQPTLERNVCTDNRYNGIVYRDSAAGVAVENECFRNGLHGIDVYDQAQPTLEGNVCNDNEESGITYFGEAGGLACENECSGNGLHGISLQDHAEPTLEQNVCTDNQEGGIVYFEDAAGVARRNECSRNRRNGIAVEGQARPALERNDCSGNGLNGILLKDQAQPTLEANVCAGNEQDGIMYADSAGGVAGQNKCPANGLHGIEVQDQARPTLEANVCSGNAQAGIGYSASAGGVARQNECLKNRWGIYVAQTANPELVDNDCHDNSEQDILDLRP